jgi:copper transport protein
LFALEATVGALGYLLVAPVVGALMIATFLFTSSDTFESQRRLVYAALTLACGFFVIQLFSLIVQGMKLSEGSLPSAEVLARYALRTQSGNIWLLRAAYTIFFLSITAIFLRRGHKPLSLFLLSLPLVASRSLSSHAAAVRDNTILAVAVDAVHLITTALWAGSLPFLLYSLIQESRTSDRYAAWAAEAVKRFSRLAIFSVTILLLTGLYQTLIHVSGLQSLRTTLYGNVLVLKLTLFVLMLLLGMVNFLSTKRMILVFAESSLPPKVRKTVFTRIGAESLLGLLILIISGFLTVLPTAAHRHTRADDSAVAGATVKPGKQSHVDVEHKPSVWPSIPLAQGSRTYTP